jgi:hypothetical protein
MFSEPHAMWIWSQWIAVRELWDLAEIGIDAALLYFMFQRFEPATTLSVQSFNSPRERPPVTTGSVTRFVPGNGTCADIT